MEQIQERLQEYTWTSDLGVTRNFSDLDHQHLSNILWFNEIFHNTNRYNDNTHFFLGLELQKFGGERLKWKPLPIHNEIKTLIRMNLIDRSGNIQDRSGNVIGSITHIEKWKSFLE